MKILHINCVDNGSTGKIIDAISEYCFGMGEESVLCTANIKSGDSKYIKKYKTSIKHEQGIYARLSLVVGLQYGLAPLSTCKIFRVLRKERPDIVHIHSANMNMVNLYKLFGKLAKTNTPVVITNHAEFFYTGNCSHARECIRFMNGCGKCPDLKRAANSKWFDRTHEAWVKLKKCLSKIDNIVVVSVSPWVFSRSSKSPIMDGIEQRVILNGADTKCFTYKPEYDVISAGKEILFCTARFDPKDDNEKGGWYIVELAKRLKKHNIAIRVVGSAHGELDKLPDNLIVEGIVYKQDVLAEMYNSADLCVIVSRRETFSMPVAESLLCGTPVVGFYAGGPETIALEHYTEFVKYGDLEALERIIVERWIGEKEKVGGKIISEKAKEKFADYKMASRYLQIYKELCDDKDRHNDVS